jgi:hypothetical protein
MNHLSVASGRRLQPALAEETSVKVIGVGGIGGIVARYGAMFLASLAREVRLVLIDGDDFEPGNATRMFFGRCGNKAAVVRGYLVDRLSDSHLSIVAIEEFVTTENTSRFIHNHDIVLLAVDNHATRKLISDYCASQLSDVCLISGGNDGVEQSPEGTTRRGTYGNIQVYLRRGGADCSPSLTRYHPEIAQPTDRLPADRSCTELLVSVPQVLFTNLAVASAMLNTLWLHVCGALHYSELAPDVAEGLMRPLPLPVSQPGLKATCRPSPVSR